MIDEKKLIEEIAELKNSQNSENPNFYVGYIVALSTVEGMIAEQPKLDADINVGSKWIPCSERLPNEDERVLIATKTTDRIYFGTYTKRYGFSMREGFICDDGFMWLSTAIAWMPLPQPYKGE